MPSGKDLAASAASEAIYGPRKTVPTVVLKAELAQSYIAQPKISLLSFTGT
jgi:acyl-CoA reductase-like NAD-dependent aldehyde dehydrogenase